MIIHFKTPVFTIDKVDSFSAVELRFDTPTLSTGTSADQNQTDVASASVAARANSTIPGIILETPKDSFYNGSDLYDVYLMQFN